MPKQFGPKVVFLVIAAAALNLAGCRTTTNKLASIPGMGWLEREDETWAKYEPSPGLPRPSDSFDPTPSSAASSIASKSDPSSTQPKFASSDVGRSKQRFDASRYTNGGTSKSEAAESKPFGNYASAYGKYGPPKSTTPSSEVAAQKGPYDASGPGIDVGKSGGSYGLASSSTSGYKAYGDSKFVNPGVDGSTSQPSGSTPSGYAANRFDNSTYGSKTPGTDGAAAYVASNSRFGGSPAASKSSNVSTYTPPGFVPNSASLEAARDYLSKSTAEASAAAESAIASGKQKFNRYAESTTQTANNYLQGAQQKAESTARNAIDTGAKAFNRYVTPSASQPAVGGVVNPPASSQAQNTNATASPVDRFSASASRFGNDMQTATTNALNQGVTDVSNATGRYAQDVQNSVKSTVNSVSEQASSQVQNYADAARSRFDQAATSTYEKANSSMATSGQNVRQYASEIANSARTAVQNVSAPIQSAYPSTNAPNPFAAPPQTEGRQNGGYSAPATSAPTTSTPATSAPATSTFPGSTPGPATMQRSSSPFQPGSTSSFQGAVTARKQTIELASAVVPSGPQNEQAMILAVGDKYQFPGTWR